MLNVVEPCGGLMVRVIAFISNNASSNPAGVVFHCVNLFFKNGSIPASFSINYRHFNTSQFILKFKLLKAYL